MCNFLVKVVNHSVYNTLWEFVKIAVRLDRMLYSINYGMILILYLWVPINKVVRIFSAYPNIPFVDGNKLSNHPDHVVVVVGPISQPRGLTDGQALLHTPPKKKNNI